MASTCPDCGAPLTNDEPCETYFHQMLFWENIDMETNGRVHHLMVLSYHLQHPAKYSAEGLAHGRKLLQRFVEQGESPADIRQEMKAQVDSNNRQWKVTATTDNHGAYPIPINWQMTAADVIHNGIENYCPSVEQWAKTIHDQLKTVP